MMPINLRCPYVLPVIAFHDRQGLTLERAVDRRSNIRLEDRGTKYIVQLISLVLEFKRSSHFLPLHSGQGQRLGTSSYLSFVTRTCFRKKAFTRPKPLPSNFIRKVDHSWNLGANPEGKKAGASLGAGPLLKKGMRVGQNRTKGLIFSQTPLRRKDQQSIGAKGSHQEVFAFSLKRTRIYIYYQFLLVCNLMLRFISY